MSKEDLIRKLTSRKFWLAVAAMLSSIGTSIAGLQSGNEAITAVGVVATVASAALYSALEAYVDATRLNNTEEEAKTYGFGGGNE